MVPAARSPRKAAPADPFRIASMSTRQCPRHRRWERAAENVEAARPSKHPVRPVKELPAVASKILILADNTTPSISRMSSGEVHFDECARVRYAVPSVPIQCNRPGMKAVPFVTHIQSPRKMSFWAVRRPVETDEEEQQLIDIGGWTVCPEKKFCKLRRLAALHDRKARKLPAENRSLALLRRLPYFEVRCARSQAYCIACRLMRRCKGP